MKRNNTNAAQEAFARKSYMKYLEFCDSLIDHYIDNTDEDEEANKKIFDHLNKKWRQKSTQLLQQSVRCDHQLFELRISEINKELGIPLQTYVRGLEAKLGKIANLHAAMKDEGKFWAEVDVIFKEPIKEEAAMEVDSEEKK